MKKIFTLALAATLLGACNSTQSTTANPDPAHNSKNALDWAGIYLYNTENSATKIELSPSLAYGKESMENNTPSNSKGLFVWDDSGNRINIDGKWYKVGENQLIDEENNQVLWKSTHTLLEKYWKLIELNGQPVTPADRQREAHIIFQTANNRFTGSGGCNRIMGSYTLTEPLAIKLGQAAATQMACPDMATEDEFLSVLSTIDNYTVLNDTLNLNKARMAPLAKFVAVYLK